MSLLLPPLKRILPTLMC